MSFPAYVENVEKRAALGKDIKAIFDEAGPDRDLANVKSIPGGKEAVLAKIQEKNTELEALVADFKANIEPLYLASKNADENADLTEGEGTPTPGGPRQTLGSLVAKADLTLNGPTQSLDHDVRNTLMERGAGWAPESTRTGIISLSPQRPLAVVDFIPTLPTNQSAVKFMRETTFTNNAAEVAEGGAYGENAFALTEISQPIEKVGAWLPITDEQLEDEEQAAAYVDQRLVYSIRARIDSQVLVGDGTTPNLKGTDDLSGINTQALGADSIPDAVFKAMTLVRSVGFAEPSVVFIHPNEYQTVRLMKTADGQYIWGPPSQVGPTQIWGVPMCVTTACPTDHIFTGDYLEHASLYVKRGVEVKLTNSHDDFFVKGKQAIRGDVRIAMVHYRESAFAQVTGV